MTTKPSITTALLLFVSAAAAAQIVSPAGTMDVMLTVQATHIDAHTNRAGELAYNIDLQSISTLVSVEYSVTDRLAVGVSLPYIQSRYRGPAPHPGAVVDDGSVHGSMQDLQLEAMYALIRGDVVVSPFAGFRRPTQDYATIGHASPGRGLRELVLGLSAGHQVAALPRAFIGANAAYTFSEAVDNMRVNRTNIDLQLGFAVSERLFIRGFAAWQRSHDGIDLPIPASSEHFHHHDQLARIGYTRGGAGLIYSVTADVNVHLGYATVFESRNSHMGRSVSVGTSWTFTPRSLNRARSAATVSALYRAPVTDAF